MAIWKNKHLSDTKKVSFSQLQEAKCIYLYMQWLEPDGTHETLGVWTVDPLVDVGLKSSSPKGLLWRLYVLFIKCFVHSMPTRCPSEIVPTDSTSPQHQHELVLAEEGMVNVLSH